MGGDKKIMLPNINMKAKFYFIRKNLKMELLLYGAAPFL